jgi:hypothetical protein
MKVRVLAFMPAMSWLLTSASALAEDPSLGAGQDEGGVPTVGVLPADADPATSARPPGVSAPDPDAKGFWELIGQDDPRPTTYEIGFVSMGMNQAWRFVQWRGGGIYVGGGGGVGSNLYRISQMDDNPVGIDSMLEVIYGNAFLRVTPFEYADIDVGGRLALGAAFYDVTDAPRSGFVRGAYVDLRVGSRKIKFGPRFEYDSIAHSDYVAVGWKLTPLMLRVHND